ncbi:MAG: T9SS type A sorting domain-containing protein [Bacteroidota bacterium]|nr:T9SS type A sorting domain-containing protein [Bacteroidota bacterium]
MKKLLLKLGLFIVLIVLSPMIFSQTPGTLTCSFTEIPKSPTYPGDFRHVLAVWIQTNSGAFVKTKLRYAGGQTGDHLPTWAANASCPGGNAVSGSCNTVDGTTGATRTTWTSYNVTWDGNIGPAGSGTLQPDGVYKVAIQSTWNHGTGGTATSTFTFTKGSSVDSQTITTNSTWSNIQITWTPDPTASIKGNSFSNSGISIYPNPTSGVFTVDYSNANTIKVINALGLVIYDEKVNGVVAGSKNIDLSAFKNGIYFITVANDNGSYNHKVVLNK